MLKKIRKSFFFCWNELFETYRDGVAELEFRREVIYVKSIEICLSE